MNSSKMLTIVVLALGLMVWQAKVSEAAPMGTAFTYQSRLMDRNQPAEGLYDFQFKLYDSNDPCTGTQLASPIDINDVDVIDGHFLVELDFGSGIFDGNAVWLETRVVRSPQGSAPATLSPLLELTPTPYAMYAKTAGYAQTAGGDGDWTISGSDMYTSAGVTGNVGIGTTNPQSKLSVGGDGFADTGVYGSGAMYGVYGSGSTFGVYGNGNTGVLGRGITWGVVGIDSDTGAYGRLGSDTYGGYFNGDGYFSGKVGIGTTIPGAGLHLKGTGYPNTFMFLQSDANEDTGFRLIEGADVKWHLFNDSALDGLSLRNNAYSPVLFAQQSNGNVGIGTTDPNQKLDVEGNAVFSGYVGIGTTSPMAGLHIKGAGHPSSFMHIQSSNWDQDAGIRLYEASALKWHIFNDWENDGLRIYNSDGSDTVFFAEQSTGNVGIGTTSPAEKLTVVSSEAGSTAVYGEASDTSDLINFGGQFTAAGSYGRGVKGYASGIRGYGVYGTAKNTGNYKNYGGYFTASGGIGRGVYGKATGDDGMGVYGEATGSSGIGVYGSGSNNGVYGYGSGSSAGVYGKNSNNNYGYLGGRSYGARGHHSASGNYGYLGSEKYGVYGSVADVLDWAGFFQGHVHVNGTLTALVKLFKIDHPLDPENKYLNHNSIESSEMMNVYSGNVVLDENGEAQVQLPDWFEALNENYRYQLTCIGGFAQVYIAEEISNNQFSIAGGAPAMKVSWQVSGVRHDPYAEDNPLDVEEDKAPEERGYYMYPEGYGHGQEKSIDSLNDSKAIEQFEEPESEVTDERS